MKNRKSRGWSIFFVMRF